MTPPFGRPFGHKTRFLPGMLLGAGGALAEHSAGMTHGRVPVLIVAVAVSWLGWWV